MMRLSILALFTLFAFACAAPLASRDESPSDDPIAQFMNGSPEQQREYIMAINTSNLHTTSEQRAKLAGNPQVLALLGGGNSTLENEDIRSYVEQYQTEHQPAPAPASE
ncbi:hypothetical protein K438DRAFT_1967291 [Mycena galopus ATCC 62051]|nr:hypothetical protein K438DRAFT_1967291 [Mycena galopus ATCC 62051]